MKKPSADIHMAYLDDILTQTEVELYIRIKPYYEFVGFVNFTLGITELSSAIVLAETGTYLKPLMVQYILATIKSKNQPYFYNQIWQDQKVTQSQESNYYYCKNDGSLYLPYNFRKETIYAYGL